MSVRSTSMPSSSEELVVLERTLVYNGTHYVMQKVGSITYQYLFILFRSTVIPQGSAAGAPGASAHGIAPIFRRRRRCAPAAVLPLGPRNRRLIQCLGRRARLDR